MWQHKCISWYEWNNCDKNARWDSEKWNLVNPLVCVKELWTTIGTCTHVCMPISVLLAFIACFGAYIYLCSGVLYHNNITVYSLILIWWFRYTADDLDGYSLIPSRTVGRAVCLLPQHLNQFGISPRLVSVGMRVGGKDVKWWQLAANCWVS